MRHLRFRPIGLAALAISFVVFAALTGTAFAAPSTTGVERRNDSPGQAKQSERESEATADPGTASADEHAAAASSGAAAETTPGDQVCDGDPSGNSDDGNGANTGGPDDEYQNDCGDPSENGVGDGAAVGQPAAGSVGNADDKNPPGQFKNGDDANGGYECDAKDNPNGGNEGVGVGNPAHTRSCLEEGEPKPEPQPCPGTGKMPDENGNCAPALCPDGSAMPANGQCPTPCPDGSEVCGTVRSCPIDSPLPPGSQCEEPKTRPNPPGPLTSASTGPAVQASVFARPAEVLGVQVSRPAAAPAALGRTGAESMRLAEAGIALTVLGAGLLAGLRVRPRRERTT